MKIYEIGTGYTPIPAKMGAATEIVVEELTKSFMKLNQDVVLIDIAAENRLPNNLPIREVKVPRFFSNTDVQLGIVHKLKRVVYSLALARTLKKIIKGSSEDLLLHFHNQYNMFFFMKVCGQKYRKNVKIAYTVHSYIWPKEWNEIEETVKKRYFQEIECVKNADYVLVLNDKTKEHFTEHLGVDPSRIFKVKNGVNVDTYHPCSEIEDKKFKESIGIGGKRFLFQVGSVCDRKNQLGAVEMLTDYLKQHPDVLYMYAGGIIDTEYQESIKKYSEDNGIQNQVVYAGELAPGVELNKYYSAANASIFPSKLESFGLVIIESISAGTNVLLAENLLFDLENGYMVYNSESELYRYMDNLFSDKKITEAGREEVINKYSWDAVAKEHLRLLRERHL